MKSKITKQFEGFTTTSHSPVTHIGIDGTSYPYFLNDPGEREKIESLQVGDIVNVEFKESKGFNVITKIDKVKLETKELPQFKPEQSEEEKQRRMERVVKNYQPKTINSYDEFKLKISCLIQAGNHRKTPKSIAKFSKALYDEVKSIGLF